MDKKQITKYVINIAKILSTEKAQDVLVFDIDQINSYSQFLIIATANSNPHKKALTQITQDCLAQYHFKRLNLLDHNNPWILMDYGSIVIHLFLQETRKFYSLEKLWENHAQLIDHTSHQSNGL